MWRHFAQQTYCTDQGAATNSRAKLFSSIFFVPGLPRYQRFRSNSATWSFCKLWKDFLNRKEPVQVCQNLLRTTGAAKLLFRALVVAGQCRRHQFGSLLGERWCSRYKTTVCTAITQCMHEHTTLAENADVYISLCMHFVETANE